MRLIDELTGHVTNALMGLLARTPAPRCAASDRPADKAKSIAAAAAKKSAAISGGLAIPAGPAGLLTILPDIIVIWKIQQQMVADIAGVFGRSDALNETTMAYCMFRHSSSSIVKDLVARVGGRSLVRRAGVRMMKNVLKRLGVRVTRLLLGKTVARLIPLVGVAAVAGYAYADTLKVAGTAIELFSRDVRLEPPPVASRTRRSEGDPHARATGARSDIRRRGGA